MCFTKFSMSDVYNYAQKIGYLYTNPPIDCSTWIFFKSYFIVICVVSIHVVFATIMSNILKCLCIEEGVIRHGKCPPSPEKCRRKE